MAAALRLCEPSFLRLLAVLLVGCAVRSVGTRVASSTRGASAIRGASVDGAATIGHAAGVFDSLSGLASSGYKWWLPEPSVRIIVDRGYPVAPEDRLQPGIDEQHELKQSGPPPRVRDGVIAYYSPWKNKPGPFAQQLSDWPAFQMQPPILRGNRLECADAPQNWADKQGGNCAMYKFRAWCTTDGTEGLRWDQAKFGPLTSWTNQEGVSAVVACCECGGGRNAVFAGKMLIPLEKRRLLAPEDKLPTDPPLEAPLDGGSQGSGEKDDQAAEDTIPLDYARVMFDNHIESLRKDPMGFSVRYYGAPPLDCEHGAGVAPQRSRASAIDPFIDYRMTIGGGHGGNNNQLNWPVKHVATPGGFFWGRWSGTVQILTPGLYSFDLGVGFNTESVFMVDGMKVKTPGQCQVAPDEGACLGKGCFFNKDAGVCMNTPTGTMLPSVNLAVGGHCLEMVVMVTPMGRTLNLKYAGPDTRQRQIIIPAQVLYCDPVILACERPELDACTAMRLANPGLYQCPGKGGAPAGPGDGGLVDMVAPAPAPAGFGGKAAAGGPPVAAAAVSGQPMQISFKMQNIDYPTLAAGEGLLEAIADKIKLAFVSLLDNQVEMGMISVELSAASVFVKAIITPPGGMDHEPLMKVLKKTRDLTKAVVEEVGSVPGIDGALAGKLGVTRLKVEEVEATTTTTTTTTPPPPPPPAPVAEQRPPADASPAAAPAVSLFAPAMAPDQATPEAIEST